MKRLELVATCLFGLEKLLSIELKQLGFEIKTVEDGRITYYSDKAGICKSNLWLRTAERVGIKLGEFSARTFDELFEGTKAIKWEDWISRDGEFPVAKASTIKSKLMSVPNIQSITKKAIVDRLSAHYRTRWFEESGEKYPIHVFLKKDKAEIILDTSGEGLHKRGYREASNKAPMRETLAAALVMLTPWRPQRTLVDLFCGSGTLLIEAALIGKNMAPGLNREFLSESWPCIDKKLWWDARREAFHLENDNEFKLKGFDTDEDSIAIARENAELAGVEDYVEFELGDAAGFQSDEEYGFIIGNPPYGERLNEKEEVEELYKNVGKMFKKLKTWSLFMITSNEEFEKLVGQKATRKRKVYNGMLKCNYYQILGPKPPKEASRTNE